MMLNPRFPRQIASYNMRELKPGNGYINTHQWKINSANKNLFFQHNSVTSVITKSVFQQPVSSLFFHLS